jgi:hypothetical protein
MMFLFTSILFMNVVLLTEYEFKFDHTKHCLLRTNIIFHFFLEIVFKGSKRGHRATLEITQSWTNACVIITLLLTWRDCEISFKVSKVYIGND